MPQCCFKSPRPLVTNSTQNVQLQYIADIKLLFLLNSMLKSQLISAAGGQISSFPRQPEQTAQLKSQSHDHTFKNFLITLVLQPNTFCMLRSVYQNLCNYFFKLEWHYFISASGFKIYCFDLAESCTYCSTVKPEKHVFSHCAVSFQVYIMLQVELTGLCVQECSSQKQNFVLRG